MLAQKEYKRRHGNIARLVHWKLCNFFGSMSELHPPALRRYIYIIKTKQNKQTKKTKIKQKTKKKEKNGKSNNNNAVPLLCFIDI